MSRNDARSTKFALYHVGMMGAKRWITEMPVAGVAAKGCYNANKAAFFTAEEVERAKVAAFPFKLIALEA